MYALKFSPRKGLLLRKKKQPQSPQVAKTWENKVVKYEALCNGASPEIQAKFREAFTPPSVEKKAELLQKMRDSAHLFDQNFAALKAQKEIDRPLKDLGKAFKQARKGEDGVMTRVQANRTQIQRDWQDYQRAFREHWGIGKTHRANREKGWSLIILTFTIDKKSERSAL